MVLRAPVTVMGCVNHLCTTHALGKLKILDKIMGITNIGKNLMYVFMPYPLILQ